MKTKQSVLPTLLFLAAIGGGGPAVSATFGELDANQDGTLNTDEAGKDVELMKVWSGVDKDANGAIDRAEFNAFETGREVSGASKQTPAQQQPTDLLIQ